MSEEYRELFVIKPGHKLCLKDIDPAFKGHHDSYESALQELEHYRQKLGKMQTLLFAGKEHAILIVLQAMDAGGKDGTINHVFTAFNVQGASVANFKQPTPAELAHDFLWRIHPHAPPKGWISIFNRSHYEDVAAARVHKLVDKHNCIRRYERIRSFELTLREAGTRILKFFLHISKDEQLARFAQRLDDPARNWKISEADYSERALWDDYVEAYEEAIAATSMSEAPWYVIPANHKWFRNLAVSQIVADSMEELGMSFPRPSVDFEEIRRRFHEELRNAENGKTRTVRP